MNVILCMPGIDTYINIQIYIYIYNYNIYIYIYIFSGDIP